MRTRATHFATALLTLQNLFKHQGGLRKLFISNEWANSSLPSTEAGKKVCDTIIYVRFWNSVETCIRASQSLLIALRIVDSDERPALPEIFAAMEFAKKKVKDAFDNKPILFKNVMDIIKHRWECQMEQQLYDAVLFLNPNKYFEMNEENPHVFQTSRRFQ